MKINNGTGQRQTVPAQCEIELQVATSLHIILGHAIVLAFHEPYRVVTPHYRNWLPADTLIDEIKYRPHI